MKKMKSIKPTKNRIGVNTRNLLSARKGAALAIVIFALYLFISLPLTITAQKQNSQQAINDKNIQEWIGAYSFEDMASSPKRRKSTDVAPYVAYDITIERTAGGRISALFSVNGTQLFEAYECSVKISTDKTEFYYEKSVGEDDGAQNLRKFRKGELLFSLRQIQIGKQTKYLLESAAYKITRIDKAKQNQPVYFIKQ